MGHRSQVKGGMQNGFQRSLVVQMSSEHAIGVRIFDDKTPTMSLKATGSKSTAYQNSNWLLHLESESCFFCLEAVKYNL